MWAFVRHLSTVAHPALQNVVGANFGGEFETFWGKRFPQKCLE